MKNVLIYLIILGFASCERHGDMNNNLHENASNFDQSRLLLKEWSDTPFKLTVEESLLVTEWIDVIFSKPPHVVRFEYKEANIDQQELIIIPSGSYRRIDLLNMVSKKSGFAYHFENNGILIITKNPSK